MDREASNLVTKASEEHEGKGQSSDSLVEPRSETEHIHPSLASAISRRCEELIIELEKDVKKLDNEFEFSLDQELSLIRASKFIKQAVDKVIYERKRIAEFQSFTADPGNVQEHLKNRENTLKDREKILAEGESELKNERFRLDMYRKDLSDERTRINQEKQHIEASFESVLQEKNKLNVQMKKLDDKYIEIKEALSYFDEQKNSEKAKSSSLIESSIVNEKDLVEKYRELERQTRMFEQEKEAQLKNYIKIEENLKERDRNLEQKKESLQVLANSLQTLKSELNQHHENVSSQMDSQFLEIKAQENELKQKNPSKSPSGFLADFPFLQLICVFYMTGQCLSQFSCQS